ncbi:MAG: hypothetical protein AB8B36_14155 [Prochlorococcus sp.]
MFNGWIYLPRPETKERHLQPASMVEVLALRIEAIKVGTIDKRCPVDGKVPHTAFPLGHAAHRHTQWRNCATT